MLRPPPSPTPFPYTTLFRSGFRTATRPITATVGGSPGPDCHSGGRVHPNPDSRAAIPSEPLGARRADTLRDRQPSRSEEHTSELQSHVNLVCRLLLEKKKKKLSRSPRCLCRTAASRAPRRGRRR